MKYRYYKENRVRQFQEFIERKDIKVEKIDLTTDEDGKVTYHVFFKEKKGLFKKKTTRTITLPIYEGVRCKSRNKSDKRNLNEDGEPGHLKGRACDYAWAYDINDPELRRKEK